MKNLILIVPFLVLTACAGGMNIPTELNYSENGELIAGRKCVDQPDGGKCCTTKVPYKGTVREVTACYPKGEVPEE